MAGTYTSRSAAGQVSVVDLKAGKVVATAKVGEEPEGVTLRPDGKVVYVTSEEDGEVAVIDTSSYAVLKKVPVGPRPRPMGIAVRPDGSMVYVTTGSFGQLFLLDPAKNQPTGSIAVGQRPWGVGI